MLSRKDVPCTVTKMAENMNICDMPILCGPTSMNNGPEQCRMRKIPFVEILVAEVTALKIKNIIFLMYSEHHDLRPDTASTVQ